MNARLSILLTLFLLHNPLVAQLKEAAEIDQVFTNWSFPETPGGALAIVKEGKIIYSKGYGSADLEHDIPISPSSVFYIGSVSKQFVTFCVLLLEEQGKLDLDDRIQKYFPDFPEYEAPLTIRHFIHHTSGVRDNLTLMELKGHNYLDHNDVQEVYELIRSQKKLNFTPGSRYLYSNSCYFMLAMVVEKVSGKPIRTFAEEQIFKPLGMTNTQFFDDVAGLIKGRVFSYQKTDDGFDNLPSRYDLVGSGGVYSSVNDLFKWDQNFYHNTLGKGGQGIIEKMLEDGLLNNGESTHYAFGLWNGSYRGLGTVSHSGSLAGYRAMLLRFPELQFSVIILANRSDADPTEKAYRVADIMLKKSFKEKAPVEKSTSQLNAAPGADKFDGSSLRLTDYTGKYYSEELDVFYTVEQNGESLTLRIGAGTPAKLVPTAKDTFERGYMTLNFGRNSGSVSGFSLDAGRVRNLKFVKK